jgi:hypothetical protein
MKGLLSKGLSKIIPENSKHRTHQCRKFNQANTIEILSSKMYFFHNDTEELISIVPWHRFKLEEAVMFE